MKKLQCCCLVFFSFLLLVLSAAAQVQNGQITGTVLDPSGAAIVGAKVTVTNKATNLVINTTSNSSGAYTVNELQLGTYDVAVEASGFKSLIQHGVTINAGTITRLDAKLQVGQTKVEVVEVSGEPSAVNTEDSKLASTISATEIASLPLN